MAGINQIPDPSSRLVTSDGRSERVWFEWFRSVSREIRSTKNAAPSYLKTALPPATTAGEIIFVSNESGGAVLAFSDGTNWRRVTDRAIVS